MGLCLSSQRATAPSANHSIPSKAIQPFCRSTFIFTLTNYRDYIICGAEDGNAYVIHNTNFTSCTQLPHGKSIHSSTASNDFVFTGARDKTIKAWDYNSITSTLPPSNNCSDAVAVPTATLSGHTLYPSALAAHPNGSFLVSGSRDATLRFWDVNRMFCLQSIYVEQNMCTGLSWWDEHCVLQSSEDLLLRVWDERMKVPAQQWQDGPHFALSCDTIWEGQYALTSHNGFESNGCQTRIWDRRKPSRWLNEHSQHGQAVVSGKFAGGNDILTVSKDRVINFWANPVPPTTDVIEVKSNTDTSTILTELLSSSFTPLALSMLPALKQADSSNIISFAISGEGGMLMVYDFDKKLQQFTLVAHTTT